MRFTDNNDGTVTDTKTGLIWLKDAGKIGRRNWDDAKKACEALGMRLPTTEELLSLVDRGRLEPALPEGHPFSSVKLNNYWSSTPYAGNTGSAWGVYFSGGVVYAYDKTYTYYVWPVKGEMK
jgi:hypothetical protein